MAMYESDHTKFMREWLQKHPEEIEESKKGRALWWEKGTRDLDTRRRDDQAMVPPKAYYYDAN
jgi:Protein of unknown function (DUF3460)